MRDCVYFYGNNMTCIKGTFQSWGYPVWPEAGTTHRPNITGWRAITYMELDDGKLEYLREGYMVMNDYGTLVWVAEATC